MAFWAIKCRQRRKDKTAGWHWDEYFQSAGRKKLFAFGGTDWIRSNQSRKYIRDDLNRGDLAVCYQYEERKIVGFTQIASAGREDDEGSGHYDLFDLVPAQEAFPLATPLTITQLRNTGCNPQCFGPYTQGTLFSVTPEEFVGILAAIITLYPGEYDALSVWLNNALKDSRFAAEISPPSLH